MSKKKKSDKPMVWEELTPDERLKYEIAEELGLGERVRTEGWRSLTSKESGRIGGMITKRKRQLMDESDDFTCQKL